MFFFFSLRQHKLEEALLFSGRFTDALQALNDWLYRAEPQLAEDVPVCGEKDLVSYLIDKHKVHLSIYYFMKLLEEKVLYSTLQGFVNFN